MTINLDPHLTTFLLMYLLIFTVAMTSSQVIKHRVAGTRGADRLRAIWYVSRYDAALEYVGVPARLRVPQVKELRSNLADAASREGLSHVIARLGRPNLLAHGVAGTMVRPRWSRGALVGVVALAATAAAHILALSSFAAAFESLASPGAVVSVGGPAWVTFDGTMGQAGHAAAVSMTSPWLWILPLLAFLLSARVWRLFTARSARRASADSVSE